MYVIIKKNCLIGADDKLFKHTGRQDTMVFNEGKICHLQMPDNFIEIHGPWINFFYHVVLDVPKMKIDMIKNARQFMSH